MDIADEIKRLMELHKSGALSDEEFAKAKAAVLCRQTREGSPPSKEPPDKSTKSKSNSNKRRSALWISIIVIVAALIIAALLTNPDPSPFEKNKAYAKSNAEQYLSPGASLDLSYECKNYYLFSIVTFTMQARSMNDREMTKTMSVAGVFGRWWPEFPLNQSEVSK